MVDLPQTKQLQEVVNWSYVEHVEVYIGRKSYKTILSNESTFLAGGS